MSRIAALLLLVALILPACAAQAPAQAGESAEQQPVVTVYKPPT